MRSCAALSYVLVSSFIAFGQGPGQLDDTWSTWLMAHNSDARAKMVQFRWKRTDKPTYQCEVQFRAQAGAPDFQYQISYEPSLIPGPHKKYAGGVLGAEVTGGRTDTVIVPECYVVDPMLVVRTGAGSTGRNGNSAVTKQLAESIQRQAYLLSGPHFEQLSSDTRSLVEKGAAVSALMTLNDGRRETPLAFALERAKDRLDLANRVEAEEGAGSENAQTYRQEASGWQRFAELLRGFGAK